MSLPGSWLRAFAVSICRSSTVERLVDPIISDLQTEYAAASHARGRRRVRWRAYAAFWKALILHAALSALAPSGSTEASTLSRVVAFSTFGFAIFTCLLVAPPLLDGVPFSLIENRATRVLLVITLIPQALPLSIPAGVCLGVLCAMRARTITRRHLSVVLLVGVLASACAWVMLEWGTPRANQLFRDLVITELANGRTVHLEPDLNELGLSRLGQRTDGEAVRHYYQLWAVCFATIPLGIFALGMAGRIRRLVSAVLLAIAACIGDVALMLALDNLSHGTLPQVIAAVWAPNAVLLSAGLTLVSRQPKIGRV
jgi:hypothetical protein